MNKRRTRVTGVFYTISHADDARAAQRLSLPTADVHRLAEIVGCLATAEIDELRRIHAAVTAREYLRELRANDAWFDAVLAWVTDAKRRYREDVNKYAARIEQLSPQR